MNNKKKILFGLLFLSQICLAQSESRKPLHGMVVNDSIAIQNGYVLNSTSKVKTFINSNGLFDILAKAKDTLLISSPAFQTRKIILTKANIESKLFMVQMNFSNNELKEIIVTRGLKVKSLGLGSQKYVDMLFEDDKQSTAKNSAMYSNQTIKYGVDFVRIFKDAKKIFRKKEDVEELFVNDVAFVEYAKVNFSPDFYTKNLGLKEDEIVLFLMYCSNDVNSKLYLKSEDKFRLMNFLVNKNQEFKRIVTFEK